MPETTKFWRNRLPHWEVASGTYFITLRCAGSLPKVVLQQIAEIQESLAAVESNSEAFTHWQRQYFMTLEKYLDQGVGFCPFTEEVCCREVLDAMKGLESFGWELKNYVIMPNHVHALFETTSESADMQSLWGPWKGRTARSCNRLLKRQGPFWHKDWFDRWMRDAANTERTIRYIRENPVKAGLVKDWQDYPWVA